MGDLGLVDLVILQQCEGQEAKGVWDSGGKWVHISKTRSLCVSRDVLLAVFLHGPVFSSFAH